MLKLLLFSNPSSGTNDAGTEQVLRYWARFSKKILERTYEKLMKEPDL